MPEYKEICRHGLDEFLSKRTVRSINAYVSSMDLYTEYLSWCAAEGHRTMTVTMFGRLMKKRGDIDFQKSNTVKYFGISIKGV